MTDEALQVAASRRCVDWLADLRPAVPELGPADWERLAAFESSVRISIRPGLRPTVAADRSARLLAVREQLAGQVLDHDHQIGPGQRADLCQTVRQLICGFYDLDLRDASGAGHGRMIVRHGTVGARRYWGPRLAAGALGGIAMTESVGGARIREIATRLVPTAGGWAVFGEKVWISRLAEASVFVVFARRDTDGAIVAVAVDAADPRLDRHPETPTGLQGWSWGRLTFDGTRVRDDAVLDGDGLAVFGEHFAHYRALVTATALGAAAAAHDIVRAHLAARLRDGQISRVRDHALISLGRSHAAINSSILAVLHTQRLASTGQQAAASLWGRTTKAFGVETARETTDQLVVLTGAAGFTADHRLQKIRRDLDALRYADGMHDSLNRSAGQQLLTELMPEPPGEPPQPLSEPTTSSGVLSHDIPSPTEPSEPHTRVSRDQQR